MSLEFWTAFGSVGTLVVIAATGIIALIQVRHLRAANQAAFLHNLFHEYEGPELRDAFHFVRAELNQRLDDPAFRNELRSGLVDRINHPEITILNWFEQLGHLYRNGAIDRHIFMEGFGRVVVAFWQRFEPVAALIAERDSGNVTFQQFELLTIEARRWIERHPTGAFPVGVDRLPLHNPWRDVDKTTTSSTTRSSTVE